MAILKTVCVIVNTLCCTLFQKPKVAEDKECLKVDEKIHTDKKIKDFSQPHQQYFDDKTNISVPLSACNQVSIRESNGERSKENSKGTTINNTKTSCHIKQQQQQQEQQNLDKEIANVNDKYIAIDNCIVFLLKLEEPYNASSRIEKIIQNSSDVTTSTQYRNLQSNCSTDNPTSALYMPCPKQEIQDTISKNRTYPCVLTSTKINSKHVKLRKRIAGTFYRCFK